MKFVLTISESVSVLVFVSVSVLVFDSVSVSVSDYSHSGFLYMERNVK